MMNEIIKTLEDAHILYYENHEIKNESYSSTGGTVDVYILPKSNEQLIFIIKHLNDKSIEFILCGGTTNLLFLDFINYKCIINTSLIKKILYTEDTITVSSGFELSKFVRSALINKNTGFDGLEGIPGTIGGAIFQNAGAYNYNISDHLLSVTCCNSHGDIITLTKDECYFSKRTSIFQNERLTILEATFYRVRGNIPATEKRIEKFHIARHSYQEWVYPNLGSVFVTTTNVYNSLQHNSIAYRTLLSILKLITNNFLYKRLFRKYPSNKWRNLLVEKMIPINFPKETYSHKSINTFTNRGISSLEIIEYYNNLSKYLSSDARLENEIAFKSISKIKNHEAYVEFMDIIKNNEAIKEKLK